MSDFLQFVLSGITVGAVYALVALGFSIIYNASHVINFAQGEFVMIGGMGTVFLSAAGLPVPISIAGAIVIAVFIGLLLEKLAIEPARGGGIITLIIITIGASIFLRGLAGVVWDRNFHHLTPFSGDTPIHIGGATIVPQTLWILGITMLVAAGVYVFFRFSQVGKAILATAYNPLAASLVGISTQRVLMISFGLSAALGAIGGVLITPMAPTHFEVGIMLGLKGFAAAIVGGLGNALGAFIGGLVVGIAEALGAGYISSAYKDAIAFVLILLVLFLRPSGLLGAPSGERV